jgi:hypothetical protein
MMISRADYLVSLVIADSNGVIDWGKFRGLPLDEKQGA